MRKVSAPRLGRAFKDRALLPRRRKTGLKLSLGRRKSLWREPWWNADGRAHPAGCAAVPAARHHDDCVCRRSASLFAWLGEAGIANGEIEAPPLAFALLHPASRFRLCAPRFGGLKPAVARRASEGGSRDGVWQGSGAQARRENGVLFISSLPGLTRQSMRPCTLFEPSLLRWWRLSMDHRVIGERSDAVLRTAMPGGDENWVTLAGGRT